MHVPMHRKLNAPWYPYPPFDIVSELLILTTIYDEHEWYFELDPARPVSEKDLVQRALDARAEARGDQQEETTDGSTD